MSLYKDPVTEILSAVGKLNNIVLNPADYRFATPQPNANSNYPNDNTQVELQATNVAAAYQGSVIVYYNRLDLADLAKMVTLDMKAPGIMTSHDLVPFLNDRYGLNLSTTDVELVDAVDNVTYKTVTLTATAGSLGWIGTVDVSVTEGNVPLGDYLMVTNLPGLNYPTDYPDLPNGQFYSYWRDFSSYTTYLKTLVVGGPIEQQLADLLTTVTGDTWIRTGYGQYSLGGASIVYAGATSGDPLYNSNYDYAVRITLYHGDAWGIAGDLILHFSEPYNPNGV